MFRNPKVHMGVLHYCTFAFEAADDAQNVSVDTARGKGNDQQNPSKMIMQYCSVYNQITFRCLKIAIILFISS